MKNKRLISALTKAGATIETWMTGSFMATKGDTKIDWMVDCSKNLMSMGSKIDPINGTVRSVRKRAKRMGNDQHFTTIKGAVQAINEPPLS